MKKCVLLLLAALLLLLSACDLLPAFTAGTSAALSEQSIWAMDTPMDLKLYGDGEGSVMTELTSLLNELDRTLSVTNSNSDLSALNESGETNNETILTLVAEAQKVSTLSGGALDITLYPASLAWGFTTERYRVVPAQELEALRERVGMEKLRLEDGKLSVPEGTLLDLGALAKGYAADCCRAKLEAAGVSGILSLGGNLQTVGSKPDGTDWVIGLQDPENPAGFCLTLKFPGSKAAVSSGDYQRYFLQDGMRYCHILDPKTLAPVQGSLRAVTVIADEGLYADALSTALFVLGREAGEALWRQRQDFQAVWVEADGSIFITPGLQDRVLKGSFEVIAP